MIKELLHSAPYAWRDQRFRYLVMGGWNTLFGYVSFVALYYALSGKIYLLLIQIAANIAAITNAFLGYKFIVFRTRGNLLREYFRFYLVYAIPTLLGMAAFYLLVAYLHQNAYLVQAAITFLTIVVSYVGHKTITFRTRTPAASNPARVVR